jgi:hypothetical protein
MLKIFRSALIAAALLTGSAAQADVHWYITGQFDDGATLSGWFDINQYGFIASSDLTTSDGSAFAGAHYVTPGTSTSNTATSLSYFPNLYVDGMTLNFAGDLNVGAPTNALLTTSYECRTNYCAQNSSVFRYITSGYASITPIPAVPEPASWGLMIVGFGLAGTAMRRTRKASPAKG